MSCLCEVPLPQLGSTGNVFAKFRFCNSALEVALREILLQQLLPRGNIFSMFCFCNSALGVCLHEVLLSQLRSRGNVFMNVRFRNSTMEVCLCEVLLPQFYPRDNVFTNFFFRNSILGEMSDEVLLPQQGKCLLKVLFPQLCSRVCLRKVPLPQLCSRRNLFAKSHFHNSLLEEMPLQSSASPTPLLEHAFMKFRFPNSTQGEMSAKFSFRNMGPRCKKTCLRGSANNKGADQPELVGCIRAIWSTPLLLLV